MGTSRKNKQSSPPAPHWDPGLRELTFGGRLVHRFSRPARVAETILNTFHEEGWPTRIDDPLPPLDGGRQHDRLRKEIYALNCRLKDPLIRFFMDGTGEGLCWQAKADSG